MGCATVNRDSPQRSGVPWFRISALVFVAALSGYAGTALSVFRDHLQRYYDVGGAGFGFLVSVGVAVGSCTAVVGGFLADERPTRHLLVLGFGGVASGYLVAALAGNYWLMLVAVAWLLGWGQFLYVVMQTDFVRRYHASRRQVLALQLVAVSLVGMLSGIVAERLVGLLESGRVVSLAPLLHGPFVPLAAASLLGLALLPGADNLPGREGNVERCSLRGVGRGLGRVHGLLILLAAHAAFDTVAYLWIPRVLGSASFPQPHLRGGYVTAAYCVSYVVSRTLLAFVPEDHGRRTLMSVSYLIGGGLFLAGVLSHSAWLLSLGFVGGAFFWSVGYPSMLAYLGELAPRRYGVTMSVSMLLGGAMGTAASTLMGMAADLMGDARVWLLLVVPSAGLICVGLGNAVLAANPHGRR